MAAPEHERPLAQLTGPIAFGWMSPHLSSMFMPFKYSLEVVCALDQVF